MADTKDCVCGTKGFSNLIANFEIIGLQKQKGPNSQLLWLFLCFDIFLEIEVLSIVYFGKMIAKEGNTPEIDNL